MELRTEAFVLKYDENEKSIVGYEDMGSVLDISDKTDIEAVGKKAFLGCKSIKKVFLPDSIESLSDWCFSKCNNLKTVKFEGAIKANIFGRGVFEGCEHLKEISFKDAHKDLSVLLAANVNRLPNEHLLRSEDLGQQGWYEKWDIALMALLNTDDAEGSINTLVCGEEDISTDGIGSVDGEMPGETDDFVKRAAKNKCYLCFLRLMHDSFLKEDKRALFENYIKNRAYGMEKDFAWVTLKEDCEGEVDYYKLYLSIVKPSKDDIKGMVADLSATQVQAKAFLINEAAGNTNESSALDDLML